MAKFRWLGLVSALLVMVLAGGCSRPAGGDESVSADPRKPPFNPDVTTGSAENPVGMDRPDQSKDHSQDQGALRDVPFNTSPLRTLPVGTLLTVRLVNSLSGARVEAGRTFAAVADEPVVIDGNTLVARGMIVQGRVESARAPRGNGNGGYVRLTLDSIEIEGKEVPLQTSSLFARPSAAELRDSNAGDAGSRIIPLKKGRRLTFRLAIPVDLDHPTTEASGMNSEPNTE